MDEDKSRRKVNFYFVGYPRCRTTAIVSMLRQHPDIVISRPKVPCYFCEELHREADKCRRSRTFPIRNDADYQKAFRHHEGESIVGDASTLYIISTEAARNMHRYNPESIRFSKGRWNGFCLARCIASPSGRRFLCCAKRPPRPSDSE